MGKYKIGDRVVGIGSHINGKIGTIKNINSNLSDFGVEFDEYIGGHDGGYWKNLGKNKHCWNCDKREIKLLNTEPNYEIY